MLNIDDFVAKKGNPEIYSKGFWWFEVDDWSEVVGKCQVQIFGTWVQARSLITTSYPNNSITLLAK